MVIFNTWITVTGAWICSHVIWMCRIIFLKILSVDLCTWMWVPAETRELGSLCNWSEGRYEPASLGAENWTWILSTGQWVHGSGPRILSLFLRQLHYISPGCPWTLNTHLPQCQDLNPTPESGKPFMWDMTHSSSPSSLRLREGERVCHAQD